MNRAIRTLTERWRSQGGTRYLIFPWADKCMHIPVALPPESSRHVEEMLCGRLIEIDSDSAFGVVVRSTGHRSEHLCRECALLEVARSSSLSQF